jgi:hypothetical protein
VVTLVSYGVMPQRELAGISQPSMAAVLESIVRPWALKLTVTRDTYGDGRSLVGDMVIAAVATVYTLFLIYAAGVDKLLLSCILYAPAAALTSRPAANAVCECSNPPRRCCSA